MIAAAQRLPNALIDEYWGFLRHAKHHSDGSIQTLPRGKPLRALSNRWSPFAQGVVSLIEDGILSLRPSVMQAGIFTLESKKFRRNKITVDTNPPCSVKSSHTTKMRLRKERKAAGLKQAQLAKLSGVPQSTISKLEREVVFAPTFETLDNLARALQRSGRKIEARQLLPRRQPALIKGFRSQRPLKVKGAA